jgi:colanic acid biosynthesis protein WcaH
MRPRFLNKDEFAQVVRNTPLVAIDLIIRDPDRCVLVGLRTNEPAKGKWFVPGGVVIKYERLADAFARIVKAEIGLGASIGDAKFIGVYEQQDHTFRTQQSDRCSDHSAAIKSAPHCAH